MVSPHEVIEIDGLKFLVEHQERANSVNLIPRSVLLIDPFKRIFPVIKDVVEVDDHASFQSR